MRLVRAMKSHDSSQQLRHRALVAQQQIGANSNVNGETPEPDENEPDENEPDESENGNAPLNTTTTKTTVITTIGTHAPGEDENSASASGAAPKVNKTVIIKEVINSPSDGSGDANLDAALGHHEPTPVPVIVGITLAGTAAIALLVYLVIRFRRKRKAARESIANIGGKKFDANANTPHTTGEYTGNLTSKSGGYTGPSGSNGSAFASMRSNESGPGLWDDDAIVALRIPLDKVIASNLLSRGGYGEVHYGTYKGQPVAIKTLLPHTRKDLRQINAFLAETKLMAVLEHPRIVRFIGVAWDSLTDLCVVSEFMEGGDLRALLTRFENDEHRPHGFDYDKVKIAFHVAHAITYLHSLDPIVLHRDLKSKNILLDAHLDAKITDFGVSRESSDKTMTAGVGTSLWMAPEVMMGEKYDDKADIFSFGLVLSELDSHTLPYAQDKTTHSGRQLPDTALLQMVSLGRLKVKLSANAPQALVDLVAACTSLDPKERPAAGEVMYKLQVALKTYETFMF